MTRASAARASALPHLPRPARRAVLITHVTVSVSWLGLSLSLLLLAVTGATADTPEVAASAYRAMKLFGDWLLVPLALTTLATGLVLALGTPWGLAHHRWVYTKFWLTLIAATASTFAFRAGINEAAAEVDAGGTVTDTSGLLFPPSVSLALYLFMTVISYLKPWGLTRRGQHARDQRARARTVARGTERAERAVGAEGATHDGGGARSRRSPIGNGKPLAGATHRQTG
ncbi:DUF2269 domain-containing protein [Streptomyces sp. 4N509B]|uniref:DUF2269 domain-containing protein n=1 Tax=Streptomyces sp. 4N509B TaxID=3457413 RepID=UPI003FD36D7C